VSEDESLPMPRRPALAAEYDVTIRPADTDRDTTHQEFTFLGLGSRPGFDRRRCSLSRNN
jgi:hypothetical protein